MSRHRKYPKTTGWYVYKHIFPNDMYYPGRSSQQPNRRWHPSQYNTTSARAYIEYFGWENVVHVIVADGLTEDEAKKLEDQLIEEGKLNGLCINAYRSGGEDAAKERKREYRQRPEVKERRREYERNRYQNDPEYRERQREYKQIEEYKTKQREYQRDRYQNDPEYREKIKDYQRKYQREYRLKKKLEKTL